MAPPDTTPALGLYVHLPWCVRKCPYCDFNSHALRGALPAARYLEALLADLDRASGAVEGREVQTVFFGGGTPSLFPAAQVGRLLEAFDRRLVLRPDLEVTLEANPGTVEHDSFAAYRAAGVNRVSLGVQSFDDGLLAAIGRIHGGDEAMRAIDALHAAGLDNFNLDLMYALPGQDTQAALRDVELALAASPAHLSHYQLTLEPNTAFAASPPALPDEDTAWAMQDGAAQRLAAAGFRQYEVSAWARPGRECRHNLLYWGFGDYLGIGAGAHGKLSEPGCRRVRRQARQRHPERYMSGDFVAEEREISADDLVFEFFLNALRLRDGCTTADFEARTGLPWSAAEAKAGAALGRGLLEFEGGRVRASELGWRFHNDLQALFLP